MEPYIHPRVHVDHHMAQLQAEAANRRLAASLSRDGGQDRGRAVRLGLVGAFAAALLAVILGAGAVEAPRSSASTSRIGVGEGTLTAQPVPAGGMLLHR
jgi:hypothetical protein